MNSWVPIIYRGFWDVPRIFLFQFQDKQFLFDCAFSEELDDYPDDYQVFLMPSDLLETELPTDWTELEGMALCHLGTVPVKLTRFDPTLRKQVDAAIVESLIPESAPVR